MSNPAATDALFQAAFSAHITGKLAEAQSGYLHVLSNDEHHADALHMLGVVHLQSGKLTDAEALIRRALTLQEDAFYLGNLASLLKDTQRLPEAEAAYRRALALKPDYVDAHYNLANLLKDTQRLPEAEAAYQHALALKPDYVDAHYSLANLLQVSQRLPEAEAAYRRALDLRPDYAEAHYNLASLLHDTQRLNEAELAYLRALNLKPDYANAHFNLANLLLVSHRLPEAEAAYLRAITIKPDYAQAHYNLASVLRDSQRTHEAETAYLRAITIKPDYAEAHNDLANLLRGSQRLPEAEAAYLRAIAINPGYAEAHYNLASLLHDTQRLTEAEAAYLRALDLRPDFAETHNNLANLLRDTQRLAEAESAYQRALALKPDFILASANLSLLLLTLQRYVEAWPLYESRYVSGGENTSAKVPELPYPQWQGQSLKGKSLVIWPEQGFGDYIQFVRYAPLLKTLGVSHLTIVCPVPLSALLATIDGVDAVVTDFRQVPAHDYWSFFMSLPLHCATTAETIPVTPMPYVHALPARVALWRDRLPALAGRKVGLVWKGSTVHKNDVHRSLPGLASLAPLWDIPGVVFVSLQKGQGEQEASQPPQGQHIVELGTQIQDFADSAAIVSQLDLVICVDTAIAHVAGALGKPCWLLLPAIDTDWRWQLDRTDSPWYPSIRLFRQSDLKDWDHTVREVATALKTWVSVPC